MTISIRDRIRGSVTDIRSEPLELPEWSISEADGLRLQSLTAMQRGQVQAAVPITNGTGGDTTHAQCLAIRFAIVGPDGKPVFNPEDLPWLKERNPGILDRLFNRIKALSGIGENSVETAKEELKNVLNSSGGTA